MKYAMILAFILLFSITSTAFPEFPIQVYGNLNKEVSDGTKFELKTGSNVLYSGVIIGNRFGYSPVILLPRDDLSTTKKEGYVNGETIDIYLEDIKVDEFKPNKSPFEKLIDISAEEFKMVKEKMPKIQTPLYISGLSVNSILLIVILFIGISFIYHEKNKKS